MSFINTGKFVPGLTMRRNSLNNQKRKSVTPTPRRNSSSLAQWEKPEVEVREKQTRSTSKNQGKSLNKKSKLYVKGNHIVKQQISTKGKTETNRPVSVKKNKSKQTDKSQRNTIQLDRQQEQKQKALLIRLFKGIQFYRDLGKGAHAVVKSGVDWNNKRKIAVKIYNKNLLKEDELKSIERQIEILGSLNHQNIIKLYEIIESIKTINLVMEYGGGNSVQQFMKSKKKGYLEEHQAKQIFSEVLRGIAYLHEKKVAHRDIKTGNILLNKHLKIKIIDFGFSLKNSGEPVSNYCGTPTYMPPEVVSKVPHHPHLADRWSLGILLYTMLHGHCPFKAQNQRELFLKICQGEYDFEAHVAGPVRELVRRFLKVSPKQRLSPQEALSDDWLQL